jgi:hypothetical protein
MEAIKRSVERMRDLRGPVEVFGTVIHSETSMRDETYSIISRFRDRWANERRTVSIYELMYEFRRLDCTDPRDRVFGFLGLASATRDFGLVPDYAASKAEVIIRSAASIVSSSRSLDLLHCIWAWKDVVDWPPPAMAYSLQDQAKYHDIAATVTDGPGTALRKGWARLPPAWERISGPPPSLTLLRAGNPCWLVRHASILTIAAASCTIPANWCS